MKEMPKPPGLQRKRLAYYIRLRVPQDLTDVIGKQEVVRSLNTRDFTVACKRISAVRASVESEFEEQRLRLKNPEGGTDMLSQFSDHDLEALSLRWLVEASASPDHKAEWADGQLQEYHQDLEKDLIAAKAEVDGLSKDHMHHGRTVAARFLKRNNITFNREADAYRKLAHYFSKAIYELAHRELRYWQGKPFLPTAPLFTDAHAGVQTSAKKITLRQLWQEYMADPAKERGLSTHKNYGTAFRVFEEIIGADRYVHLITREECKEVRRIH